MNRLSRARRVFDIEIAALKSVRSQLDGAFDTAVDTLVTALRDRGKVVVVGVGKSGNIGQKIAATLSSTGSTAVVLNIVDALHGDLGVLNDHDAVLALSYSGESDELLSLLPALKTFGVKLISLTGGPRSTLARHSDVVISVKVPKEACPFNFAPTASTTAMLAMGDALALAVMEARGFKLADFARYHPSGAIGRALLVKVRDIMRSGDRNPVAREDMSVRDALLAMTKAKAGIVSVVNSKGILAGVFTDGDFRRRMMEDKNPLAHTLSEVMSPNPICVQEDALAAEALNIFKERSIDDLIVVNTRRQPVGLVDLQDLPKMKIM
jgi:arabinose-5-phosphate isomerase